MSRTQLLVQTLEDRTVPSFASLDPSFGLAGTVTASPNDTGGLVAALPDGRVLLVGTTVQNGVSAVSVARFSATGQLDAAFGTNGRQTFGYAPGTSRESFARAVAVQPDGKVVVVGSVRAGGADSPKDFAALRLNSDGSPDGTFGTAGRVIVAFDRSGGPAPAGATGDGNNDVVNAVAVMSDGRIVLAGYSAGALLSSPGTATYDFAAARLTATGALDGSFGAGGKATISANETGSSRANFATGVAIATDGVLVLAGYAVTAGTHGIPNGGTLMAAALLTSAGQPDASFGIGGKTTINAYQVPGFAPNSYANAITLAADGNPILVGTTAVKLTRNGNLDRTFGTDGIAELSVGGAAAVTLANGRILIAGTNRGDPQLTQLTASGLLDPSFGTAGRFRVDLGGIETVNSMALLPSGDLFLSGTTAAIDIATNTANNTKLFATRLSMTSSQLLVGGPADGTASRLRTALGTNGPTTEAQPVTFFSGTAVTVRTAVADVNGDGVPDLIGVTGPGVVTKVSILDGLSNKEIVSWQPFESGFTGGLFVVADDLDGDLKAEVVISADQGGGPIVAVYSGAKLAAGTGGDGAQIVRFSGIDDPTFRGGARVALADVNGDGVADLIVAAGFGGGPRVAIFNGKDVVAGSTKPGKLIGDFFVFESGVRNGAFVTGGDLNGDGIDDLAFGGGPGGAPRVRVVDGRSLLSAGAFQNLDDVAGKVQIGNFFAGGSAPRGGVRLIIADGTGDGLPDVIAASGDGEAAKLRIFKLSTVTSGGSADRDFDPFGGTVFPSGVFVG